MEPKNGKNYWRHLFQKSGAEGASEAPEKMRGLKGGRFARFDSLGSN